jgi:hypothetical protein
VVAGRESAVTPTTGMPPVAPTDEGALPPATPSVLARIEVSPARSIARSVGITRGSSGAHVSPSAVKMYTIAAISR